MPYMLGDRSRAELNGVHPALVALVKAAIVRTPQDFTVLDGLRTVEEQRELVARGASRTMNSRHMRQASTGFGHAVDLVPVVSGKPRWEWPLIYPIAETVRACAREMHLRIRWGGVWDACLNDLAMAVNEEVFAYTVRHEGADFIDGPHYELL